MDEYISGYLVMRIVSRTKGEASIFNFIDHNIVFESGDLLGVAYIFKSRETAEEWADGAEIIEIKIPKMKKPQSETEA